MSDKTAILYNLSNIKLLKELSWLKYSKNNKIKNDKFKIFIINIILAEKIINIFLSENFK